MPVGQLAGVTVTSEGLIQASFSNGDIVPLGKVALAKFSTPTGLRQIGNSYWSATGLSGTATMGSASADGTAISAHGTGNVLLAVPGIATGSSGTAVPAAAPNLSMPGDRKSTRLSSSHRT